MKLKFLAVRLRLTKSSRPSSIGPPDAVFWRPCARSARVLRVHNALDVESEQGFVLAGSHAARHLIFANLSLVRMVIDEMSATHNEKLVVSILRWKSVQRVPAVALQIGAFGRRANQRVEDPSTTVGQIGCYRGAPSLRTVARKANPGPNSMPASVTSPRCYAGHAFSMMDCVYRTTESLRSACNGWGKPPRVR